jgi:hypothetical protein
MLVSSIFLRTFESLYTPPKLLRVALLYAMSVDRIEVARPVAVTVARLGLYLKYTSRSM